MLWLFKYCMYCGVVVDLLADMYENAHKSKPDSEEILNSLFMAYVRLGTCKKQQQVSVGLLFYYSVQTVYFNV